MKNRIRDLLHSSGAIAVGFAEAGKPDWQVIENYEKWIESDNHAGMSYLEKHKELRGNTDYVLPGAKTVISLAFSYAPSEIRDSSLPLISTYALGYDYHDVIRKRLKPLVSKLKNEFGGNWRICIDSAPIAERYWAVKSGLGIIGKNGAIIVKGCGSYCFLAEILTTIEMDPDEPIDGSCIGCGKCIDSCPGAAINDNGTIDSRKCFSYLTIEKKGEFNEEERRILSKYNPGILFGCDICLKVCPHNRDLKPSNIEEFKPRNEILSLMPEQILEMNEEEFRLFFKGSPLKRAGLSGLHRNVNQF